MKLKWWNTESRKSLEISEHCSSNLAPKIYITKKTKWPLWRCCHGNSFAAGPVLIRIEIYSFCLKSTIHSHHLIRRVKITWEQCLLKARPSGLEMGILGFWQRKAGAERVVMAIKHRCHFFLWYILLVLCLKITAPIFLGIVLIQYVTILVAHFTTPLFQFA